MKWNPLTWFREVPREDSRKAFVAGIRAAREEYAAGVLSDAIKAQRGAFEVTLENIGYANKLDASDPAIAAVIEAFKTGVVEQVNVMRRLLDHQSADGNGSMLESPFGVVESSTTNSAAALPEAATQKALPSGNGSQSQPSSQAGAGQPKRGRGRPRKYPRPGEVGTGGNET